LVGWHLIALSAWSGLCCALKNYSFVKRVILAKNLEEKNSPFGKTKEN